jgi:hypothetical protein
VNEKIVTGVEVSPDIELGRTVIQSFETFVLEFRD